MKTPAYEQIAERAYQLWETDGRPHGRDIEHWLKAERQLSGSAEARLDTAASHAATPARTAPRGTQAQGATDDWEEEVRAETASESAAEYHISPPMPEEEALKAALQKKEARDPKVPHTSAPRPATPVSGKPLWSRPHSA